MHFYLHDEVEPEGRGTSVFMTISSFGPVFPRDQPAEKSARCRLVGMPSRLSPCRISVINNLCGLCPGAAFSTAKSFVLDQAGGPLLPVQR
jgi:hypothetical protein